MNRIFKILRRYRLSGFILLALSELKLILINRYLWGSYSQVKEDLYLDKMLGYKKHGFYVDVGAFDPFRFSNTMRFYRRGWRGINIEPNYELWKRMCKHRPLDKNLNVAVGEKMQTLTFFNMDPPTLSTFSSSQAYKYTTQGFRIKAKKKLKIVPLKTIFAENAKKRKIDFLSLDVEGFEMSVLKGNDWNRYRPRFLCIETAVRNKDKIEKYLKNVGYTVVFDNGINSFYEDTRE